MDQLRVFHDVAQALTSTLELDDILNTIMNKMATFFGPERWSLLIVDQSTQLLHYAIAVGEDAESLRGLTVPLGEGVAGWVAATGSPLVVPDVMLDTTWSRFAIAHPELDIRSIACFPLRSGNTPLGAIQLLNSKLDLLSEYSLSFLRVLCDYAAIAIRNANSMKLIHELSITDDCTGLFNARHLYTLLEEEIAAAGPNPTQQFSLVFFDLDHFKSVNDTHGHLIGSRLLAEVGSLMKRTLTLANPAFRYGGDEFVALIPNLGKAEATALTLRLFHALRDAYFLTGLLDQDLALNIRGSFGLATFPEDGLTIPAIIRSADTMMYEAKVPRDNIAVHGRGLLFSEPLPAPAPYQPPPPPAPPSPELTAAFAPTPPDAAPPA